MVSVIWTRPSVSCRTSCSARSTVSVSVEGGMVDVLEGEEDGLSLDEVMVNKANVPWKSQLFA